MRVSKCACVLLSTSQGKKCTFYPIMTMHDKAQYQKFKGEKFQATKYAKECKNCALF